VLEITDSVIRAATFDADSMKSFVQSRQQPRLAFALRPNGDLLLTDPTPQLVRR